MQDIPAPIPEQPVQPTQAPDISTQPQNETPALEQNPPMQQEPMPQYIQPQEQPLPQYQAPVVQNVITEIVPTTPIIVQPHVTTEEKVWGALAYLPMVAVIALLVQPQSAFVRLHARQGLMFFVIFIVTLLLDIIFPLLGLLLGGLIQLALIVGGVYSAYQSFLGNWWKIPVLGDIAEKIPAQKFTQVATQAITGQPVPENPDQYEGNDQNPPSPNPPL